ncbi:putative transporter [Escovopsis weberi]|uniref:Putative transporter n=1 Tax=Escovopsis weberi TaxID=150374 RepID=A0A0M9VTA9_ESCWE|nr:putative transporter [Escovopsis weberi]
MTVADSRADEKPAAPTATPKVRDAGDGDGKTRGLLSRLASVLCWTPDYLKWKPDVPFELTWRLNSLFAVVSAFEVANLAYTHPILHILAQDFDVSEERASLVPTMIQTGYTVGLLLICPAGDLVRRRPAIILLALLTALFWLGCTLATSFEALLGLHFLVGMFTVTPQFMFPLIVRYAPARHRATMTAVTMSGLTFGTLLARLISGLITQYVGWRVVFWVSFGLQMSLIVPIVLCVPDFPVASAPGATYPGALLRTVTMPLRQPVVMQQALLGFLVMAMFTCFWTTLTFQLADVFRLSTLVIGLFALVGLSPLLVSPVVTRVVLRRIHPWGSLLGAHVFAVAVLCVGTVVGRFSVAGVVIWAALGDLAMSIIIVSNRMCFAGIEPRSQSAVNAVYMVISFCGQLFGTAVGNKIYARGGWIHSGAFAIGLMGLGTVLVLVRGPHAKGWFGYAGGCELRLSRLQAVEVQVQETTVQAAQHSDEETPVEDVPARDSEKS